MPSRVIRGEINESDSLSQVSIGADLAFRALLLVADDYGRMDARPAKLKAALFPMRDEVSAEMVMAWLHELSALADPPLEFYEVAGRPYLHLVNWEKHRGKGRRAQDSRYPPPPSEDPPGDPRKSEDCHADPPGGYGGKGVRGRGTRDELRGGGGVGEGAESPPAVPARARGPTDPPDQFSDDQRAKLRAWRSARPPDDRISRLTDRDLLRLEETALDWYRAKGRRQKDWVATVRTWIRRDAEREGPATPGRQTRLPEIQRAPPPPKLSDAELKAAREAHDRELAKSPFGRDHLRRQAQAKGRDPPETPEEVSQAISASLKAAGNAREA